MFTGIVHGMGKVVFIKFSNDGGILSIFSFIDLHDILIGSSIAVNGVCLTVIHVEKKVFKADVSPETLKKTNLNDLIIGSLVNLEKALSFSSYFGGHLVLGHVDGISYIKKIKSIGKITIITFSMIDFLYSYMVEKGSIAIDGISLTINKCDKLFFEVSVIPHTMKITVLGTKRLGNFVNIEVDIVGKYIEKFVKKYFNYLGNKNKITKNSLDINLSKKGYI